MKYKIIPTTKFKKDYKNAQSKGYMMVLLDDVIIALAEGKQLDPKYKDHSLKGNLKGYRECHIKPDWLLIYTKNETDLILTLCQTGTHSELFGK